MIKRQIEKVKHEQRLNIRSKRTFIDKDENIFHLDIELFVKIVGSLFNNYLVKIWNFELLTHN